MLEINHPIINHSRPSRAVTAKESVKDCNARVELLFQLLSLLLKLPILKDGSSGVVTWMISMLSTPPFSVLPWIFLMLNLNLDFFSLSLLFFYFRSALEPDDVIGEERRFKHLIFRCSSVDCEQSLFCSKIRGEK